LDLRGGEILEEAVDVRLAGPVPGPPVVAVVEAQEGVVSVGAEQRRVVAGVELGDVASELDEQGPWDELPAGIARAAPMSRLPICI